MSELMREAFRLYKREREWNEANAYGRSKAKQLGVTEVRTIAEASSVIDAPAARDGALPHWSTRRKALYWADRDAHSVLRHAGKPGAILAHAPAPITALALHREGLLVAHENGWQVVDDAGGIHAHSGWPGPELRA